LAALSRDEDNFAQRIAPPAIVFESDGGGRYAIAAVESRKPAESLGTLEVVVLEWSGSTLVTHWRLPVPEAAQGTYRSEDDADAVALAERMVQAWDDGDTAAAQEVLATDMRVHWFGDPAYEGLEEVLASIEGAHSIGNSYESITTPTVVVETDSERTYAVSIVNVTGPGHPNGSLVITVSEIAEDQIVVWIVFFTENLPYR
jgi:hypothetical protein